MTTKQLCLLNKNTLLSLHDDLLTKDNVEANIVANPHTIFLAPVNATVQKINQYVTEPLFKKEPVLRYNINGLQTPMLIYKNMTVTVMEISYFPSSHFVYFINGLIYYPLVSCETNNLSPPIDVKKKLI